MKETKQKFALDESKIAAVRIKRSDGTIFEKLPIHHFAHWLALQSIKDIRRTNIKTHGKRYYGVLVTKSILDEYRRDRDVKIDTLVVLAAAIERLTRIPASLLYKHWKIAGEIQWAVFLPTSVIWKFKPRYGE